jgi:hypothetical protein
MDLNKYEFAFGRCERVAVCVSCTYVVSSRGGIVGVG